MPTKYIKKLVQADELKVLLGESPVTPTMFQKLTGVHRIALDKFLDPMAQDTPQVSHLVILEFLTRHPAYIDEMMQIADDFIEDWSD